MIREAGGKSVEIFAIAKRFFAAFVFACVLVATGYAGFSRVNAAATPPRIVMYQGRLLNSNNVPVSDATASISFALYSASSGGTCLWSNNNSACASVVARTVTLTSGLFSEALGDTGAGTPYAAIPATAFADNASVYLEVIVNGETLTPRKQMLAAPYAMNADTVDGYQTSTAGGTSSIVTVTDGNGNLVITGSPQGTGVSQGSLYINPDTGVVAANEILLGIAVTGTSKFTLDGEGDGVFAGDITLDGGDLISSATTFNLLNATVTTLNVASAATTLNISDAATTKTIHIGGVTNSGTDTINIATNATAADVIAIGNSHASTTLTLTGGTAWSMTSGGNLTTSGDVAVNGNDLTSSGILRVTSGGGAGMEFNSASGIVNVAASDDFVVGGTTLASPFSIDESLNTVRIGDASNDTNDPTVTFYASDGADSGSLSYGDDDTFTFTGGNISHTGNGTYVTGVGDSRYDFSGATTYSGTSDASLSGITMFNAGFQSTYSGVENVTGTDHYVGAASGILTLSGSSATLTRAMGVRGLIQNNSTSASLLGAGGYMDAVRGEFRHNAAATALSDASGVHGYITSSAGTLSNAYAVFGEVATGAGTVTTGYGGRFTNTTAGTTRYGLFAQASGGTTNYSGYFASGAVHIDDDTTASIPDYAKEAGDLYVMNDLEVDGSNIAFGDGSGEDSIIATLAVTAGTAFSLTTDSLTSGSAFAVGRAAGGADYDGTLVSITQSNTAATSDGDALLITNSGGGNSIGLLIRQNTLSSHVANNTGNNALVIDVNEAAGSENVMIIRSDADGTPDTEFRIESDGDVFGDGAAYVSGADYAEFFKTSDPSLGDYQLVCQDPETPEAVEMCTAGNSRYLMGVVSTNPAFVGNNFRGASENLSFDAEYRKIGMVGQIETLVNANEGAIAIGDPISTSATLNGYGAKSRGPARIVGFALEAMSAGKGTIRVLVQPQWYGGDVLTEFGNATQVSGSLAVAATTAATSSMRTVNSPNLQFRGSVWNGTATETRSMSIRTTVTAANDYRLSVANHDGIDVATVSNSGDLTLAGKFYPSDRGAMQSLAYIYYDGSPGAAGGFMRTNASGWATGSYDFAETFPSPDALQAGELVVFGSASQQVTRSPGVTYSPSLVGIVSTKPGFLAGENRPGQYPIALAGRVPTFVTTENGSIRIGDPLTTSSTPGHAMKATAPGPVVGYAAEEFSGTVGKIIVYVNVSYYAGAPVKSGPAANNSISRLSDDIARFDTTGTLSFNGGRLLAVGSIMSASNTWRLESNGDFITAGRLVELVQSSTGEQVETYAATTREATVQLSGTVRLEQGRATVRFLEVDPKFTSIVDVNPTYRALVTPYGATGALYVTNRTADGFDIVESGTASNGVDVDWIVLAYRRDFAPVTAVPAQSQIILPSVVPSDASVASDVTESTMDGSSDTIEVSEDSHASSSATDGVSESSAEAPEAQIEASEPSGSSIPISPESSAAVTAPSESSASSSSSSSAPSNSDNTASAPSSEGASATAAPAAGSESGNTSSGSSENSGV